VATTPFTQEEHFIKINTPLEKDALLLEGFSGQEAISSLFQFHLDLIAENTQTIAFDKLLGQKVAIEMTLPNAESRYFHGIVSRFSQGGQNYRFTRYSAEVVPQLWLLTRTVRSRIFQHMSVIDILKKVLDGVDVSWETQGQFQPRDYCVQYRESDFHFASRLMEEEGIYYFFKHAADSHKMVVANSPQSHPDLPYGSKLIYEEVEGGTRDEERIFRWEKTQELRSGKHALWDHCFELPGKHLEAEKTVLETVQVGKITHKLKVGGNDKFEIYDYPGGYAQRFDGIDSGGGDNSSDLQRIFDDNTRTVGIRMQQETLPGLAINCASNCRNIVSGHKFNLMRHFNADAQYVVTSISHVAQQGYGTGPETGTKETHYSNVFACIPIGLPFRPLRITPRPFVHGSHTATVVGPPGEEIYTDKYSRVKVQFHWDREGKSDADSSCWVRLGSPWAGKQWGMIHIPRIGQEVIVDFLEGDPDQPIIVGSVYNADQMPPYTLPDNKTQSGIRSRSSKGGSSENYNEIKFEDNKGNELITIHAEKDQLIEVEHDETIKIHHDQMITVENDRTETVKNNETVTIRGDRKRYVTGQEQLQTDGDLHLTASQNQNEKVGMTYSRSVGMTINDKAGMNYAMDAGLMIHLKAGMSAVIEAGMGLTIKSAGGSIDINPVGVFIQGNLVFINTGAANIPGCGSSPTSPASPGKKILEGLEQATGSSSAAAASAASNLAQQAQQQMSMVSSMATNVMGSVSNQAFGAVSQVAEQSLAAAQQSGQVAQGAASQVMSQINNAVSQAQSTMANAVNQAQGMLNAGMNAVRTGAQQSLNQAAAAASQLANQASQLEQQAQQQLQQAASQAQQAAQQAMNQGQQALGQALEQGQQMLNQAQQTAQQAQQQLQQAANQAQQAANQAVQQGQQAVNQATQQAAQMAQQAQQTANQAVSQAQTAANQLQQTANLAVQQGQQQIAQAAQQAQQAANQAAQSAQQAANQAQQLAQQTQQQAQQMIQQTQQQVTQAANAAQQQVTQTANQAQQQVTQATQQATQQAAQAGQMAQQTAHQVQQQVGTAAAQAAKTIGNTAQAACQQAGNAANQAAQSLQHGLGGLGR
jgi:type VI secretion system secreted protein VgrG